MRLDHTALSLPIAAQFLRCRGRSLWLQRCDFRTAEKPFLLTTAAQNIHVFLRKSPLHKKHFFEWLKTAISSNACGTSTLKSLLPQGAYAPHVHPRLRKCRSRCTLDCGFKTSESPALRGFVAERAPIRGTSLYLVLKSNGLHRPENLPVKFDFSPKSTSTNIAKKLPLQRCFKPLLIVLFNFSHKRPTFAFTSESGYTLAFRRRIAHSGLHAETRVFQMGVVSLPSERSARSQTSPGRVSEQQTLPLLGLGRVYSRRTQRAFGTAMRLCASLFRGVAAPLGCVIPLLFLLPHRWVSRFWSAASLAHRKLSACSLVTAVRFLNRCLRRSMRETYPLEQRSGCRF